MLKWRGSVSLFTDLRVDLEVNRPRRSSWRSSNRASWRTARRRRRLLVKSRTSAYSRRRRSSRRSTRASGHAGRRRRRLLAKVAGRRMHPRGTGGERLPSRTTGSVLRTDRSGQSLWQTWWPGRPGMSQSSTPVTQVLLRHPGLLKCHAHRGQGSQPSLPRPAMHRRVVNQPDLLRCPALRLRRQLARPAPLRLAPPGRRCSS